MSGVRWSETIGGGSWCKMSVMRDDNVNRALCEMCERNSWRCV